MRRFILRKHLQLIAPIDNIDKLTDVLTALKDAGIALSGDKHPATYT